MKHSFTFSLLFLCLLKTAFLSAQNNIFNYCSTCLTATPGPISQSAFGDYDNDGDLDLLAGGLGNYVGTSGHESQSSFTRLYTNNGVGIFSTNTTVSITGMTSGEMAWADYDRDGNLDFAIMGVFDSFASMTNVSVAYLRIYRNNGNGSFSAPVSLPGIEYGGLDWADYDNDGDPDLLTTGVTGNYTSSQMKTTLYRNDGPGTFTAVTTNLPALCWGNVKWGDYDNDGDHDVLICGQNMQAGYGMQMRNGVTGIYRNDGNGTFTDIQAGLPGVTSAYAAWKDYDNDGYLDFALQGYGSSGSLLKIYRNQQNGTFADLNLSLSGTYQGKLVWGDFNGDGNADLISSGQPTGYQPSAKVYLQSGTNQFSLSQSLSTNYITAGDCNGDKKPDLIGSTGTYPLNLNQSATASIIPPAPITLNSRKFGNDVLLTWDAVTGSQSMPKGYTYNVRMGTASNGINTVSPASILSSGFRQTVSDGNAGHGTHMLLKNLPAGTYHWAVQAQNPACQASAFSLEGSFTMPGRSNFAHVENQGNDTLCSGAGTTLEAYSYPAATAYQWYRNNAAISNARSGEYTATQSGTYKVVVTTSGGSITSNNVTLYAAAPITAPQVVNGSTCLGQNLSLQASPGSGGTTCTWYDMSNRYLATGTTYTPGDPLNATTSYKVYSFNAATGCSSSIYTTATAIVNAVPAAPVAQSQSACQPQTFQLTATPGNGGNICRWYDHTNSDSVLAQANTFNTGLITRTKTWHVSTYDTSTRCESATRTSVTAAVNAVTQGPVTTDAVLCVPGNATLSATPGANATTCYWYEDIDDTTPVYTGTSVSLQNVTSNQTLFVSSVDPAGPCESAVRSSATVVVNPVIGTPSTWDQQRYGPSAVTLEAWPGSNATNCRWYSSPSKTVLLGTGKTYTTPVLEVGTTSIYYVSSYDEPHGCEGTDVVAVQVRILPVPAVPVNPDQMYPVPDLYFGDSYKNVNLFTGDVNLSVDLVQVEGPFLEYTLNAFYNSRSAGITPLYIQNQLGGLGWKMMDYPKVVQDGVSTTYYLLDGYRAHALTQTGQTDSTIQFAAPGSLHLWSVTMSNLQQSTGSRDWTLVSENGTRYLFRSAAIGHLDNNQPGYRWDLSSMYEAQGRDSIVFTYQDGHLQQIKTSDFNTWNFSYDGQGRVASIEKILLSVSAGTQYPVTYTQLSYNALFPNTSYGLLSSISSQQNVAPPPYTQAQYQPVAPPVKFTYNQSNYPGALETMQIPQGGSIEYQYSLFPWQQRQYQPVTAINTFSGTTFSLNSQTQYQYSPTALRYSGPHVSGNQQYLHFNQCEVIPGGNQMYGTIGDQTTSFEKGIHDAVFKDLDPDYISATYALSGSKSYFFDGYVEDNTIHSKKFTLNRKTFNLYGNAPGNTPVTMSGAEDSVRVAFYLFDTHSTLNVTFLWTINFYDINNKHINSGSAGGSREIDDDNYGTWLPVEIVQAIPPNAAYFDFKIVGGRSLDHYDFYMDDVSVSGSRNTLNGKVIYHYFNGGSLSELAHLPDDYFTRFRDEQVKSIYQTGFEPGEGYANWLNLDHSGSCKPSATVNDADHSIACNGSAALGLSACNGDYSKVYTRNDLNIPSGTDRLLLSFHYSSPQFSGMQFKLECSVGSYNWDTTFTVTGSYFTNPSYTAYFKWFDILNTSDDFSFTIRATNAGGGKNLNEFFLDDLSVVCIDTNGASLIPPSRVTDPSYLGMLYHTSAGTQDNQELSASSFFWVDGKDALAANMPLVQCYRQSNVAQGVAKEYLTYTYRPDGRTNSTHTTRNLQMPDGTYQAVWYLDGYVYADSLYPSLGRAGLHLLDALAASVSTYSTDQGSHWSLRSANLSAWSTLTPSAPAGEAAPGPIWTTTAQYIPRGQPSLSTVYSAIRHLPSQVPAATFWTASNRVLHLNTSGIPDENRAADSLIAWQSYSVAEIDDEWHKTWKRKPMPVAKFGDATPQNSYYYGCENYEAIPPGANNFILSNNYFYTGGQSVQGTFYFTMPFSQGETPGSSYLISFQYLATSGAVKLTVSGNTGTPTIFSQSYTPGSSSQQWQSVQQLITVQGSITQLKIQLQANGSNTVYFDDIRVLPATSSFTATSYEMNEYSVRSIIDNNGADMRFLYNWKGLQWATIGPGKIPLEFQTSYFSRMAPGGQDLYNPLIPNSAYTIKAREGGHFFAFNDQADRTGWSFTGTSGIFSANKISMSGTSTGSIPSSYRPTDYGNFGIAYQLLPVFSGSSSTIDAGVSVGIYKFTTHLVRSNNQIAVTLNISSGSSSPTSLGTITYPTALYNPVYSVMVIFQQNRVHVWLNDQYITNSFNYTASSGTAVSLFYTKISGSSSVSFADISIFNAPEIRAVFTDGLNNSLQQQEVTGNDLIVHETQYDLMMRPVLQTKKVLLRNRLPGFQEDFITSFDWQKGEMLGTVQQAKNYILGGDADQKYMYWRCLWNGSPESQLQALYNPGYDFARREQTNIEKAEKWAYTHEEQIFETIKYTLDLAQIILQPESAPFVITADLAGLVQKHFSHNTDNLENEVAVTSKFYDPLQRQVQLNLPWANTDHKTKPGQILQYGYDANGNMTVRHSPESDTTRSAYDHLGRLRFSQDAIQADSNLIAYYKYDRWSRPLETGIFGGIWNQANLENQAETSTYPASGTTRLATYSYDGTEGSYAYLAPNRGKLTRVSNFQNNSVFASNTYNYDLNGRLVQNTQTISGNVSAGSYPTHYQYNAAGNVKLVQYPNWNNAHFQVRYSYDYLGNLIHIGDSTAVNRYTTYEWNPDGTLMHETLLQSNNTVHPVWHFYNAPGWPDFSGFGDTIPVPGIKYSWWGLHPTINYDFSFFSIDLDYNLLTDWWSDLWGQRYYNGKLASATYKPFLLNPAKGLNQGYLYNESGNLESYYSDYAYDHYWDSDFISRDLRDTFLFDLNENLVERTYGRDLGVGQHSGSRYKYHYSDTRNRPTYIAYSEFSNQEFFNHYRYDTLDIDCNDNGYFNLLHWTHRNATGTYRQPGSVEFQYWKRPVWDRFARLDHITYRDTGQDSTWTSFSYDGGGMRIQKRSKWFHGSTLRQTRNTTYIRNTNGDPLMEIITGGSRDTVKYFVWGPTGIEVMYLNDAHSTKSWFVMKDNLGCARQLVDRADGSVDEYYATDAYGTILTDNTLYHGLFNYIYTGQEYDRETGLHYFRARMYDPFSKLFLSPDPAGSNPATPYAFVKNDPVNATDPTGEIPFEEVFEATAAEIAAAEAELGTLSTDALGNRLLSEYTRTRNAMIEFRRRFDNPAAYKTDFKNIYKRSNRSNLFNPKDMGNVLRPGGNHEMLPVSTWRQLQQMGVKLEDIQKFSRPTADTYFQIIDPVNTKKGTGPGARIWLPDAIPHGDKLPKTKFLGLKRSFGEMDYSRASIGSTKTHNEIIDVVWSVINSNGDKQELLDEVARWMAGRRPEQLTKVYHEDLEAWMDLLNQIR